MMHFTTRTAVTVLLILTILTGLSATATLGQAQDPPEYRLSCVYGFASEFANPTATSTVIDTLANSNFNVVMPEIRKSGDAYYNSAFEPWATDVAAGYDPLADIITKAHARNMEVYGWIVTYRIWNKGKVAPANHIWTLHPEWATLDTSGRNYVGSYHNLDPGVPGVEEYIVNLVRDIVTKYPELDGICFDYIRYDSTSVGYNPISTARFKAEYGVNAPTSTSSPDWANWSTWKRRQITDLMKRCYVEATAINPQIKMTADTIGWMGGDPVNNFEETRGYKDVCQDSKGWMNGHFLDVNILMNYKRDWTRMLADVGFRYKGYAFGNQSADYFLWSDYLKQMQDSSGRHCVDTSGGYMNIMQGILNQWGYDRGNGLAGLSVFRYGFDLGTEDPANPGYPLFTTGTSTVAGPTAALENTFYSTVKSTMFQNPAPVPTMPWKETPTKGYLLGRVTNTHWQDDPIYGAWMYNLQVVATAAGGETYTAVTDATGTYGFLNLEPGDYRLSINKAGYLPVTDIPVSVTAGIVTKQDLQLTPDLPLEIRITFPTSALTYLSQNSEVTFGGTIVGNMGGKVVTWTNDRGGSGVCAVNGTNWISSRITLLAGTNVIKFNASDAAGNTDRQTITITYEPPMFVSSTGDDSNDGSSWILAKKTIQSALDASASGRHIWVAVGRYNERITLKQNVHLFGGFAGTEADFSNRDFRANATIVEGTSAGPVVTCTNITSGQPTLDGFTITNGLAMEGGGIYIDASSPIIRNNVITGNLAMDYGGGIYCHNGSPVITNNTISGNMSNWLGGGVFCGSTTSPSTPTIANNIIADNSSDRYGGGVYCAFTSPTITNNTIADNFASSHGGAVYSWDDSSPVISNNIVALNTSGIYRNTGSPVLTNNCVYGNTAYDYTGLAASASDINTDPLFVNSAGSNYHISGSSPCKNAGSNTAPAIGAEDIDGEPRMVGGAVDIGADESVPAWCSVPAAKKKDPATVISLQGMIVTATFSDFFYIETADRSSGVRVDKPGHGLLPGMRVSVFGDVNTDTNGECHIDNAIVANTGFGQVKPLTLANRGLGGGDLFFNPTLGAGQDGVMEYHKVKIGDTWEERMANVAGLNNIGLLITTFGRVTYSEGGCFYIDDGSALSDGSGLMGVKIIGSIPYPTPVGKYVKITGISSCYTKASSDAGIFRRILATDVQILQ